VSINNRVATKDHPSLLVCMISVQTPVRFTKKKEPILSRPFPPPKLPRNVSSPRKAFHPIILENCKSNQEPAILIRNPVLGPPGLSTE
jgi:hypothetical protein